MGMDHFIADELLCRLPISFADRCRERVLIHLPAAHVDIFCMVLVAEDIGEEHLAGRDRLSRIVRNRRRHKTRDVTLRR